MSAHSGTDNARYRWYATINNFSEEDIERLQNLPHKELVIGKEEAPSTGTSHLHVYISLEKKLRLSQMKEVSSQAHWEPVKSRDACIGYCTKDGEILHSELLQKPTKRELCDAIDYMQTEGLAGVAREFPYQYSLHSRGLRDLQYALVEGRVKPVP
nr:MAG: replication-associated protein [Cressdnaviricota sp.]